MDVFDKEKRSLVMSRIRSVGAKSTELKLRSMLEEAGYSHWQEHDPSLPGRPDFSFPEAKVAVFVDGCFWHGCPHCHDGHIPKSNCAYWSGKIARNKRRDRRVSTQLRRLGWTVIRVWECRLKENPARELKRILRKLDTRAYRGEMMARDDNHSS